MSDKKVKTKRNKEKFPFLKKELNVRTRFDLIDYDYLDKLSDEEKDWLNRFTAEEVAASFNHANPLDDTTERKRASYKQNNKRNHCIYSRAKATHNLIYIEDMSKTSYEDTQEIYNPEELYMKLEERLLKEDPEDLEVFEYRNSLSRGKKKS